MFEKLKKLFVFKEKEIEIVVPKIAQIEPIKRQNGLSIVESSQNQKFKFCLLRGTPQEICDKLVEYYGKRPFDIYSAYYDATNNEAVVLLSHA